MSVRQIVRKVKPTRKSPRHSEAFGVGILPFVPFTGRTQFTATDEAEAAAMFATPASEPLNWIDQLQAQIKSDLVRCEALGRRQDALAARIEMSKRGIRPISGGAPTRFAPSPDDLEDVFGRGHQGDDAQFMTAAG
jgi:hypothetical protein